MERRHLVPAKRSENTRTRRRRRCWGQITIGVCLGLFLGLFLRTGLQRHKRNETCGTVLEAPAPLTSSRPKYNEDPLKTIGMNEEASALVLVGVMTAQKYLESRAVAVFETWGRVLPGRVAFFSSEVSTHPVGHQDLPLIRLKGVDDSYPPQKKSFKMLEYMWENYGDRFEWFIRADDDVYIRHDKLEAFLRSIDSKKPWFIGQAGRGNQEEFGLLSLEYDENFCMGGPGIIMSRETLKRVAPHIKYCLRNLFTTHEDVELGRCIRKFANVSCTWSYEMQTILYHNSSGRDAYTGNLKQKEVHRAITLHPVKQPQYLYRIHNYVRSLQIQELQFEKIQLQRDLRRMHNELWENQTTNENKDEVEAANLFGLQPSLTKFQPRTEQDVISWDFIQRSLFSEKNLNPRRRIEVPYKEGIEDVIREVMEMINQFSRQRGRVIEYQDLLYGYYRIDPLHGPDYILDLLLKYKKYRGRKMTVPVRRHAYLQQQFLGYEIREISDEENVVADEAENTLPFHDMLATSLQRFRQMPIIAAEPDPPRKIQKTINFILPLLGRFQTFQRFMQTYEDVCLEDEEAVSLIVVVFRGVKGEEAQSANSTLDYLLNLKVKYPTARITSIPVGDNFARALALQIGTAYVPDDDRNILFYIDVDMVFTKATLQRVRRNTIRGKQVYFPIVFSEFDPTLVFGVNSSSPNHFMITRDTGYWRQFGFGIASAFRSDITTAGGFNTAIRGWGKEDVDLYDRFVKGNITIFRAADPGLVHVFHVVDCAADLEPLQLQMCIGTRSDTYGSVDTLSQFVFAKGSSFFQFLKNRTKLHGS